MEHELGGKTALVTGSGRNLGRAIALEFASLGANVVINARSNTDEARAVEDEAQRLGAKTLVVVGDVSQQSTVDEISGRATEAFGGVDILVSNAALRPYQSFLDMPVEDWSRVLDTQLTASFRLAKALVPHMMSSHWGRIIHITGPDAYIGMTNRAHNVTAKAGLRGLTKSLALELGPHGITVNDVAPGHMNTERNQLSHPTVTVEGSPYLDPDPDRLKRFDNIPVGRLGEPEDLAYACAFLASPRASFFTGNVLFCFGGQWLPC